MRGVSEMSPIRKGLLATMVIVLCMSLVLPLSFTSSEGSGSAMRHPPALDDVAEVDMPATRRTVTAVSPRDDKPAAAPVVHELQGDVTPEAAAPALATTTTTTATAAPAPAAATATVAAASAPAAAAAPISAEPTPVPKFPADPQLNPRYSPLLEYWAYDATTGKIALPPAKEIIIDVGQANSPLLPLTNEQMVIGFEPIYETSTALNRVYQSKYNNRFVSITSAVTDREGIAVFQRHRFSDSSSLRPVNPEAVQLRKSHVAANFTEWLGFDGTIEEMFATAEKRIVPTVSLAPLLYAIPDDRDIRFLKVDAQGMDLEVLKGCGDAIRRVHRVEAEATIGGVQFYKGSADEKSTVDYMESKGFQVEVREVQTAGEEVNLFFWNPAVATKGELRYSGFVADKHGIDWVKLPKMEFKE